MFFGVAATGDIAKGTFDLGFHSMAVIFQELLFGRLLGCMWFLLLFFAASCVYGAGEEGPVVAVEGLEPPTRRI